MPRPGEGAQGRAGRRRIPMNGGGGGSGAAGRNRDREGATIGATGAAKKTTAATRTGAWTMEQDKHCTGKQ